MVTIGQSSAKRIRSSPQVTGQQGIRKKIILFTLIVVCIPCAFFIQWILLKKVIISPSPAEEPAGAAIIERRNPSTVNDPKSLEDLFSNYGSDKGKDDHKYSDFYQMIFNPIRLDVTSFVEIGVDEGRSLQAWHEFFPNAKFVGIDSTKKTKSLDKIQKLFPRISFLREDILTVDAGRLESLGLKQESVNIVVDAIGPITSLGTSEETIAKMFGLVKPGGYYIIEGVGLNKRESIDTYAWVFDTENLMESSKSILYANDVVFVDSLVGHHAWEARKNEHDSHNSNLVVIRKRMEPPRPIQINLRRVAMKEDTGMNFDEPQENTLPAVTLEALMYKYGSDKSKDDHKYTDLYQMLFDPIRERVQTVLEVGVAAGQSMQAWHGYFRNATILGIDITRPKTMAKIEDMYPRVKFRQGNMKNPFLDLAFLDLRKESMDIVIDDADHQLPTSEAILANLFDVVKPGGFYIIEDVGLNGGRTLTYSWVHAPENLTKTSRDILMNHDAVFVDSHIGHRDWKKMLRLFGTDHARDHRFHNSHLIVIRKREKTISMNDGEE